MNYAIIAAGKGSRLSAEGIVQPKPLVQLQQRPLIGRLLDLMRDTYAESISVVVNPANPDVVQYLQRWQAAHQDVRLQICVRDTESSMHSLAVLSEVIPSGRYILTTVDTVFRADDFRRYVDDFRHSADDGLFAVTSFVDDEKPLWISTDKDGYITRFADDEGTYVSGGVYGLNTATSFPILRACVEAGQSRMRNYQRALLAAGLRIKACSFGKIIDIDHADDIRKAERFLATGAEEASGVVDAKSAECSTSAEDSTRAKSESLKTPVRFLLIGRDPAFSPNSVDKDAAILQAVGSLLSARGGQVRYIGEEALTKTDICAADVVLSMARRWKALMLLGQAKVRVVNAPQAVMTVAQSRSTTMELLQAAGVRVADFWSYEPSEDTMFQCEPALQRLLPGWVKGMHPDGVEAGDVTYVATPIEADTAVLTLSARHCTDIIVARHCPGTLVKVYCIALPDDGQGMWLRWFLPQEEGYTKFGDEVHNSPADTALPVDEDRLREVAARVSEALHLQLFGYDAILGEDGTLTVIDVNDWPSYSRFCAEAAECIAGRI